MTRFLLTLVFLGILAPVMRGQSDSVSFSTLTVRLSVAEQANRTALHPFWNPRPGLYLTAETPLRLGPRFLTGPLQAGLYLIPVPAQQLEGPDFVEIIALIGWSKSVQLPLNLQATLGVQAGNVFFQFDDPNIDPTLRRESEFMAGLAATLRYELTRRWTLQAEAAYLTVFTAERLRPLLVSVGLSHSFRTPDWLKTVLR